jgi:hypothetical protein
MLSSDQIVDIGARSVSSGRNPQPDFGMLSAFGNPRRGLRSIPLLLSGLLTLIAAGCGGSAGTSGGLSSPPPPAATPALYTAWGDSLTAGCEDGTSPDCSYPYQLQKLIQDSTVNNEGIGGQTSTQIAVRMGAVATNVTNSFTIPSSGSATGVNFKKGYEPCFNIGATGSVEGTIDGVQVYCQDAGSGSYTLTRVSSGAAVTVNSGDLWTPVVPAGALSGMNIIWAGRNNTSLCPTTGVTTSNCPVAADIDAMTSYVAAHGGRYLVLTVINGELDGYAPNSSAYYWTTAIDSWITATYPTNSYDIREPLVAAYDPSNPVDVWDHSHDIPPFSLRAFDSRGTLAAGVSSTTTCAISFGRKLGNTTIAIIGSEYIFITSGSDGNYNCIRGFAGSTAATFPSGTAWVGDDPLHLSGYGTSNTANPNGPGYTLVARLVQSALAKQQ